MDKGTERSPVVYQNLVRFADNWNAGIMGAVVIC